MFWPLTPASTDPPFEPLFPFPFFFFFLFLLLGLLVASSSPFVASSFSPFASSSVPPHFLLRRSPPFRGSIPILLILLPLSRLNF